MGKINVLLVEDDEDQIFLTKKALASGDFEVESVMKGKAGLKKLGEDHYDMLLLDYRLPDISGIEILKAMKKKDISVPTIMITGAGSEMVAVEAMKLGAVDYIVKSKNYHAYLPHYIVSNFQKYRLEIEIKETRELLKNVVENSADIIISTDLDGRITSCNRIVEKISGWKREELQGSKMDDFVLFKTLYQMSKIREKVKKGTPIKDFIVQGLNRKNQPVTFNITISPVKNGSDKIVGTSIIARDITEKVKMEERIKQAEKEVKLYERLLRHNINNLNQIAIGYLSLMSETGLSGEQKKLIVKTRESIKSSTKLIDKVGRIQKSKNNFDEIYREIASDFSQTTEERR